MKALAFSVPYFVFSQNSVRSSFKLTLIAPEK